MDSAAVVRELLAGSGLAKSRLSALSGVSRALLDDYLHGRRNPSLPQLERLARAAGFELELGVRKRPRPAPASFLAVLEFGDVFPRREKPAPVQLGPVWQGVARGRAS